MTSRFSSKIYSSWREKQRQKYAQLYPSLKPFLSPVSLLDLGIGQGWFEEFLREKGHNFSRTVGFDVGEEAVKPRLEGIEYVLGESFQGKELFDFVVCFDAYHLMEDSPLDFVKPGGLLLVALPLRWARKLEDFAGQKIMAQGEIGEEEVDKFLLIQKD